MSTSSTKKNQTLLVVSCVALIIFWASLAMAATKVIGKYEEKLFDVFYNIPAWLTPLFVGITLLGSIWVIPATCLILMWKKYYTLAARVLVLASITYAFVLLVKQTVSRSRPDQLLLGVVQRGYTEPGPGFPSGHSAIAAVIGVLLMTVIPEKYWWIIVSTVVFVGVSRMYLGMHTPLDIVGGFAIGVFVGTTYLIFASLSRQKKIKKS